VPGIWILLFGPPDLQGAAASPANCKHAQEPCSHRAPALLPSPHSVPARVRVLAVRRWVHLYTHHLQEKVVSSIGELYDFMNTSNNTLDLKVLGEVRAARPGSVCAGRLSGCGSRLLLCRACRAVRQGDSGTRSFAPAPSTRAKCRE